jgi:hypothetical protein
VKWIAQVPFTGVRRNGIRRSIHVRVGTPRRSGRTAWACPVEVSGVLRRTPVYGEDALQALCLALDFVGNTLYAHQRRGLHLKFPTGHSVPLFAYFRLREMRRRLVASAKARAHRRSKRPPNRPLERAGMNRSRAGGRASAGRSAASR